MLRRLFVNSLLTLILSVPAFAQTAATNFVAAPVPGVEVLETRIGPRTYGTTSATAYLLSSLGFGGWNSATTFDWAGGRYITGGIPEFVATINLPAGALMSEIEIEACDTNSTGEIRAYLTQCNTPAGPCGIISTAGTGFAETPGCGFFATAFTPVPVENETYTYFYEVLDSIDGSLTRFAGVRLYYKLQVSPAPLTATFLDVPVGHPQHRFVEALVAAGITVGCGGGNYCPTSPVTRGQMAVFLAAALGLHWAP